ncbi:hypothetical protein M501DRAFT_991424 [Patellaria atrata CBS 101060]|uniref:NAD(P)-binding domain-containing protein n=1 Tax=Patellaria atrata CBS 101060 TaxID=1346257 RepID=A0A9P4SF20_9PEZI|nr:hypothetical protein M501DRAFT_991424 [Patellaria atrata CBS 101060]
MHLILTGATGLVGSAALAAMLANKTISRISIISRKPVTMGENDDRVKVIIKKDFKEWENSVLDQLKGAKGCVWASGPSQNDVNKEDYIEITKTQALNAAKTFSSLNVPQPFNFVYVSGEGATTKPGIFTTLFGRVKGETEAELLNLMKDPSYPCLRPISIRPGGVDPTAQPEVMEHMPERWRTGWRGNLGPPAHAFFRVVYKNMNSPTKELGEVLVNLAAGNGEAMKGPGIEGEGRTITNKGFRSIAGI